MPVVVDKNTVWGKTRRKKPTSPPPPASFSVGSKVKWKSQAAGTWVVKVGYVIEVVQPLKRPTKTIASWNKRTSESYVIEAQPVKTGKAAGTLGKRQVYWPNASVLKPWNGGLQPADVRIR